MLDAHRKGGRLRKARDACILGASIVLAVIGTVQVALASEQPTVGGLHPLLALAVLGLAEAVALRAIRRHRDGRLVGSS